MISVSLVFAVEGVVLARALEAREQRFDELHPPLVKLEGTRFKLIDCVVLKLDLLFDLDPFEGATSNKTKVIVIEVCVLCDIHGECIFLQISSEMIAFNSD